MPRRRVAKKREVAPDPVYKSRLVTQFVGSLLYDGKRSKAERIFYRAMEELSAKQSEPPLSLFRQAVENVKPLVETKTRRVGGASYQIPVEVPPDRRTSLAIRWLIHAARERSGKSMQEKLAAEILDAAQGASQSGAIRRKEEVHKMAEANKAFAHYRW